jgi:alkylhydroperoxidase family enzyme
MGHSEMLLAVAGLDEQAVAERTHRLSTGDWSSFPSGEQAAFAFARRQARKPWSVGDADVQELVRHFGPERTLDVIWWACRCNYMTRVADAFQLPLERENVFEGFGPPKEGSRK